jgi:hypothetical protein
MAGRSSRTERSAAASGRVPGLWAARSAQYFVDLVASGSESFGVSRTAMTRPSRQEIGISRIRWWSGTIASMMPLFISSAASRTLGWEMDENNCSPHANKTKDPQSECGSRVLVVRAPGNFVPPVSSDCLVLSRTLCPLCDDRPHVGFFHADRVGSCDLEPFERATAGAASPPRVRAARRDADVRLSRRRFSWGAPGAQETL